MRPPLALVLLVLTCSCAAEPQAPGPEIVLQIELDERPVWIGDVIERAESPSYVYLRLSIVSDSATPRLRPHVRERWVALEGPAPQLGERVRVRSLARRRSVWEPTLEREFDRLEYVAVVD